MTLIAGEHNVQSVQDHNTPTFEIIKNSDGTEAHRQFQPLNGETKKSYRLVIKVIGVIVLTAILASFAFAGAGLSMNWDKPTIFGIIGAVLAFATTLSFFIGYFAFSLISRKLNFKR